MCMILEFHILQGIRIFNTDKLFTYLQEFVLRLCIPTVRSSGVGQSALMIHHQTARHKHSFIILLSSPPTYFYPTRYPPPLCSSSISQYSSSHLSSRFFRSVSSSSSPTPMFLKKRMSNLKTSLSASDTFLYKRLHWVVESGRLALC